MATPPLILVVGMHRSGTSLLGSILQGLGVATPGELIPGDGHNPEGYFERRDISDLQEQLLIELGRWWPSAAGADPLPADWLNHPATQAAASQLKQLLGAEQARRAGPWAIKDPRTSLLLPLWRQVAGELGIPLRLVLSVRDPAEVMVSLLQRDAHTTGMTGDRAQRLWWHHNRRLLLDAGELPLLVLDYGAWFEPAGRVRQLQLLCRFCTARQATAAQLSTAAGQIQPSHRRSRRHRRELPHPIHPWLTRLAGRLRQLARQGTPPRRLSRLQRWLASPARAMPPDPPPGPWFDPGHYRRQTPRLAGWIDPWLHYRLLGWRRGRSPHPLFSANHYRHQAHLQGLASSGAPLSHFLRLGLNRGLAASALADPAWSHHRPEQLALLRQARLEGLHPWGRAALAVCQGQLPAAIDTLERWLHHGLTAADLDAITVAAPGQFSGGPLAPDHPPPLPAQARVAINGAENDACDWRLHAWLQHLPLPPGFALQSGEGPTIQLLLGPLPQGHASLQLIALAREPWVFAADPGAIPLLQRLGITASPLNAGAAGNGWLDRPSDAADACRQLGLPPATALAERAGVLCLGSAGPTWERRLGGRVWCWPGFAAAQTATAEDARLLASWLNACNRSGLQLVILHEDPAAAANERRLEGWRALQPPASRPAGWLPPQTFHAPLQPEELLAELAWRAAGAPPPEAVHTPRPTHRLLWQHRGPLTPEAAVCVSLHNYADRILPALASVAAQSLEALELLIVDDASSDQGPERVQRWLEAHGERFCRALLVQHDSNGGLAAARNTAFQLAQAPWCFVLDADNTLEPGAVAECLALASAAPASIAVVHPLVELVREDAAGCDADTAEAPALLSGVSWQRHHFLERNVVDAMALVRRSAWERVGGYAHIPGGWEDYDFWCKLIEADFSGMLCPQRLARYHSHGGSMLATETHQRLRAISRILQQRHPWLRLHLAASDV